MIKDEFKFKEGIVLLGDSKDVLGQLKSESIDLCVTDPPYLINYKTGRRKDKTHAFCTPIINDDNPDVITSILPQIYRCLKRDTAMYMFCSWDKVDFFKSEISKHFLLKNMIIWVKNNHTAGDLTAAFGKKYEIIFLANKGRRKFNGKRLTDVWQYGRVPSSRSIHQNEKPVELLKTCILKHSEPGDTVLDPFAGSCSTAIAAIEAGRRFVCIEQDKEHFINGVSRIYKHAVGGD